jgi:acyl carrier protein
MKEKVEFVIYKVIDEINLQLIDSEKIEKLKTTVLFGDDAKLDSLGLINFIVQLELQIDTDFGKHISIIGENTMDQDQMPFETVASLIEYIHLLLEK